MSCRIVIVDPSLGADGIARSLNHQLSGIQDDWQSRIASGDGDDGTVHVVACCFVPALGLVYTVELR